MYFRPINYNLSSASNYVGLGLGLQQLYAWPLDACPELVSAFDRGRLRTAFAKKLEGYESNILARTVLDSRTPLSWAFSMAWPPKNAMQQYTKTPLTTKELMVSLVSNKLLGKT